MDTYLKFKEKTEELDLDDIPPELLVGDDEIIDDPKETKGINKLDTSDGGKQEYYKKKKTNFKPGIDYGLGLLSNNRVKDTDNLSNNEKPKMEMFHSKSDDEGGDDGDYNDENGENGEDDDYPHHPHHSHSRANPVRRGSGTEPAPRPRTPQYKPQEKEEKSGSSIHMGGYFDKFKEEKQQLSVVESELQNQEEKHEDVIPDDHVHPHDVYDRKKRALKKLERLRRKGYIPSRRFTMDSSLRHIEDEIEALKEERAIDISIKAQQKLLLGAATGIELLNNLYNPFNLELDGFSDNIYENIGDYDEIFEELHEKYGEQFSLPVEIRLLFMFFGSAIMFHFSKTVFNQTKEKVPQFEQIMSKNPELRKAYQQAAMNEMGQAPAQSAYNPPPNQGPMGNIMGMFGDGSGSNPMLGNMMNLFMRNRKPPQTRQSQQEQEQEMSGPEDSSVLENNQDIKGIHITPRRTRQSRRKDDDEDD
jgi:hypothetical protein